MVEIFWHPTSALPRLAMQVVDCCIMTGNSLRFSGKPLK